MKTLLETASDLLNELRARRQYKKCPWCHGEEWLSFSNSEAPDQGDEKRKCGHCSDGYTRETTHEDAAIIKKFEAELKAHNP